MYWLLSLMCLVSAPRLARSFERPVYVSDKKDYPAVSEVGFPNFCKRKTLPPTFTIKCRLNVKERAYDNLTIKVKSLRELMDKHKKGQVRNK